MDGEGNSKAKLSGQFEERMEHFHFCGFDGLGNVGSWTSLRCSLKYQIRRLTLCSGLDFRSRNIRARSICKWYMYAGSLEDILSCVDLPHSEVLLECRYGRADFIFSIVPSLPLRNTGDANILRYWAGRIMNTEVKLALTEEADVALLDAGGSSSVVRSM
jgi:hypothetical protein